MTIVRKATDTDMVRLCRTAMHAFADDPLMRWLYPDDDEYFLGDGLQFRPLFRRWLAYDQTFTTDDSVSVAAFIPPGRPDTGVVRAPDDPPHTEQRLARFTAMSPSMAEHTPEEPHWYLNLLGTHPHWRRQGLGAAVIGPIWRVCDDDGLPLYLETATPENVAYYNHLGFAVRSEWDRPLDGPHMWGMIRFPRRI